MDITQREAARRLGERHRLSRDQARRVLAAGLAGEPRRIGAALLYDADALDRLMDRPMCERKVLDHWRPLIVRLGCGRVFRIADDWAQQATAVAGGWRLSSDVERAWLERPSRRLPLVAVLGGFVVFGADVVGTGAERLELEQPGPCWGDVEGSWLPIKNGPAWTLWGAPPMAREIDWLRADIADQMRRLRHRDETTSTWARRAAAARIRATGG